MEALNSVNKLYKGLMNRFLTVQKEMIVRVSHFLRKSQEQNGDVSVVVKIVVVVVVAVSCVTVVAVVAISVLIAVVNGSSVVLHFLKPS